MQGYVGGETKACFARSKSMDFNDLLIHINALNIQLSRNLITQSRRDHFHVYINKWQLTDILQKGYPHYIILIYWERNFIRREASELWQTSKMEQK